MKRRFALVAVPLLLSAPAGLGAASIGTAAVAATVGPVPASAGHIVARHLTNPPTTAFCESNFGIACYSPNQLQAAYDVAPLYDKGINGKGRTIAVVDPFGSPTIAHDLQVFDTTFGLPAPPSLKTITPAGPLPPFDPTDDDMTGWAFETTLDVEYAHAIAPGANIVVVATPVSETEGVQGFPEIVKAENYVIDHGLADVISQSFGATEETFPTKQSLLDLRGAFENAQRHHVSVLGASGDEGATDYEADGETLYPNAVTSWPASDPLVTAVGGTQLFLDATGKRTSPDVVWNDGYGAGGGGLSTVFGRPIFQTGVRNVVGQVRGVPDISMSAAVDGGAIVYVSYDAADLGYQIVGGTSEASPLFSGVVALAAQLAHHSLGDLNPAIYALGAVRAPGLVDVTSGNNSFAGVTGASATKGYDLASGWGTVDAAQYVPALAVAASLPH